MTRRKTLSTTNQQADLYHAASASAALYVYSAKVGPPSRTPTMPEEKLRPESTQATLNKASRHNIINSIYFTVDRNSNTGGICLDVER
jgi:hypothetical protein